MTHVHLCGWCAIPSRYLLSSAKRPRPLRLVPGWAVAPCQKISASAENGILEDFNTSQIHFISFYIILSRVMAVVSSPTMFSHVAAQRISSNSSSSSSGSQLAQPANHQQIWQLDVSVFKEKQLDQIFTLKLNSVGCGFDTDFRYWTGCVAPSVGFFPGQSACTGDCIYRGSTFASCSNCRTNGLTNKNKTYKKKNKKNFSEQVSIVLLTCCLPLDLTADSRNLKLNWHGPNTGAPSADWPSGQQLV